MLIYDGKDTNKQPPKPSGYTIGEGGYIIINEYMEKGEHMPNNPINFRPNDEDLRILDAIKAHLTKLTKLETYYNAAIRYALRTTWEELQKEDQGE